MRARSHSVANVFAMEELGAESAGVHKALRSAPKPTTKPAPPPTVQPMVQNSSFLNTPSSPVLNVPSVVNDWSTHDVVGWVNKTLVKEGYDGNQKDKIVANFEEHLIRGETLSRLDAEDWKTLVPFVGARKDIQAELQRTQESISRVNNAALLDGEGANREGSESYNSPFSTPRSSGTPPLSRKDSGDIPLLSTSPNMPRLCIADMDELPGSPGFSKSVELPVYRPQAEDKQWKWKALLQQSRFSQAPVIDNDPEVPKGSSSASKIYRRSVLEFLKFIYLSKTLLLLITWRDLILCFIPVGTTLLCEHYGIVVEFNPGLFLTSLIFPLSFAVNAAYQRRELALQVLGFMKACSVSLFQCHRTWSYEPGVPQGYLPQSQKLILNLFNSLQMYLTSWDEEAKERILGMIYEEFLQIALQTDTLRLAGIPPPLLTRPIHDLREVMASFERLRVLADYRTPSSIRAFIKVAIIVVTVIMSPAFAAAAKTERVSLIAPFVFFLLLKLMVNVQDMLENPFSTHGLSNQDDINLDYLRGLFTEGQQGDGKVDSKPTKIVDVESSNNKAKAKMPTSGSGSVSAGTVSKVVTALKSEREQEAVVVPPPRVPHLPIPSLKQLAAVDSGESSPNGLKPKKSARIMVADGPSAPADNKVTVVNHSSTTEEEHRVSTEKPVKFSPEPTNPDVGTTNNSSINSPVSAGSPLKSSLKKPIIASLVNNTIADPSVSGCGKEQPSRSLLVEEVDEYFQLQGSKKRSKPTDTPPDLSAAAPREL